VLDSYEVEIVCGDREWVDTRRFGSQGAGPGEIRPMGYLFAGPEGTVAYADPRNRRVSIFSDSLDFIRSVPIPALLSPAGDITADWIFPATSLAPPERGAAEGAAWPQVRMSRGRVVWFSLDSGAIVRETFPRFDPEIIAPAPALFAGALESPSGAILGRIGQGAVAWFSPEGEFRELVQLPEAGPVLPTQRNVDRYIADIQLILGRRPSPEQVDAFRKRPLSPLPRGGLDRVAQVDGTGRLWLATTRTGTRGTLIYIVDGSEYRGSLEIEGGLVAFQLRDSLLAVLVESLDPDPEGLYPRWIDWYRIVESHRS